MIRRVVIEHWKSIEKLDLELGPLTVIVGANGSGKSNFVDALRFVRDAVDLGLDQAVSGRRGMSTIRQWSPGRPNRVTLTVHVEAKESHGHLSLALDSQRVNYTIQREQANWRTQIWPFTGDSSVLVSDSDHVECGYARDRDGQIEWVGDEGGFDRKAPEQDELFLLDARERALKELRTALMSFEAYMIYPETLRSPQPSKRETRLHSSGENLTSILKALAKSRGDSQARDEIISMLKLIMPNLENIRIQSLGGLMTPMFRVVESNGERHDFNVSQISDGTLRILGLLTALYQPEGPATIALEEPEQTVDPDALAVLADAIKDVSEQRQIIVTTHSPHLVDHFDPEVVYAADMEGGVTTIRPISSDQKSVVQDHLFSLSELMAAEGLHG